MHALHVAFALLFASANCLAASSYTYQVLDLWDGHTILSSVNNSGQIAGYLNKGLESHGIIYSNGSYEQFDVPSFTFPGTTATIPQGINNGGDVVGLFSDSKGDHGFLRDGTSRDVAPIDFPFGPWTGPTSTHASGINNAGYVVGAYVDNDQIRHGFIYDGSGFAALDFPGATTTATAARGINDSGVIVGTFNNSISTGSHGFIFYAGQFLRVDAPIPDSYGTGLYEVNNNGQAVGGYTLNAGGSFGFVYENGSYSTISVPGFEFTTPFGINDHGVIVGTVSNYVGGLSGTDTRFRGFIATPVLPVPIPSVLPIFVAMLVGAGITLHPRRWM